MTAPRDPDMSDDPEEAAGNGPADHALAQSGPRLMRIFFIVAAINLAGLVWLGVRTNSSASVRASLDVVFQLAVGGGLAFASFRALIAYPFLMTDLFAMVLVLGAWLRVTVDGVAALSKVGMLPKLDAEAQFGQIIQVSLFSISVLVAGAAIGLRTCLRLQLKTVGARLLTIVPAMLALPAGAGCAAFALVALAEFTSNGSNQKATLWMVCWFASVIITFMNLATFIRLTALNAEIKNGKDG